MDRTDVTNTTDAAASPSERARAATVTPITHGTHTAHAPEQITLEQLKRLLRQPVGVYFRERLRLTLQGPEEQTQEDEPFALDRLAEYRLVSQIAQADDVDDAVQRLRLGGALALGGFGQLQARQLADKGQELHAHGQTWLTAWPDALPPQQQVFAFDALPALQAQWAHQAQPLWRARDGRWLQLQWRAGNVLQGEKKQTHARIDTLTELWLHHLVACASGQATTSVQIGLDAQLRLDPLDAADARAHLRDLVELWLQAWQTPLPVPRKTACAWLLARQTHASTSTATASADATHIHANTENDDAQDADQIARAVFTGSFRRSGEWAEEPTLQRLFPEADYDALRPALEAWAERLYGPLRDAVRVASHRAPQEPA